MYHLLLLLLPWVSLLLRRRLLAVRPRQLLLRLLPLGSHSVLLSHRRGWELIVRGAIRTGGCRARWRSLRSGGMEGRGRADVQMRNGHEEI